MLCESEITQPGNAKIDLPGRIPSLTSLYMYIAGSCNLSCRHCWIAPDYLLDQKNGRFLSLEFIKKAISEAKPLGLQSVKLSGGEPTVHPRFREIVDFIDSENIRIILETNGTLISDESAQFLKSKPMLCFVSVSLDGAKAETHDSLRGVTGSFDQAVTGIKALAAAGFKPQLICTLHRGNVAEIDDLIHLASSLGCGSIKFNNVQKIGRGKDYSGIDGLDIPEIIDLHHKIEMKKKKNDSIMICMDIPFAFFSIHEFLKSSMNRCSVLNILGILSNGDYSICGIGEIVPELVFGNVQGLSIGDIWMEHQGIKILREQIPGKLEGICGHCIFKSYCLGTCVAQNYNLFKKITAPYYFCFEAEKRGLFPNERKI